MPIPSIYFGGLMLDTDYLVNDNFTLIGILSSRKK